MTPRRPPSGFLARLDDLLHDVGIDRDESIASVRVHHDEPHVRTVANLEHAMGLPMLASAIAAADLWQTRGGTRQDIEIDLAQAVHAVNPLLARTTTLNGHPPNLGSVLAPGHGSAFLGGLEVSPLLTDVYRTRDSRWVLPSAFYPRQRDALLALLGVPHDRELIGAAIASRNSADLEEDAARAGVPLAVVRTRDEFESHPQGKAVLSEPLIGIERIGDAPAAPLAPAPRPLDGVRVLSFTRAIAGPVVGRTLAEHGADVLHVNGPHDFEHDMVWADVGVGMRSARLDIATADGRRLLRSLLSEADVFVQNVRPSRLAKYGFGPDEVARIRPGIVCCSLSAYGFSGPWADRTGFDTQGLAFTGYHTWEGSTERPVGPPTGVLNDFILGYLGALGVLAALRRRIRDGGSHHVKLSLARLSAWYPSLGELDPAALGFDNAVHRLPAPRTFAAATPLGELVRLASPVTCTKTSPHWRAPLLVPRGSSQPEWEPR